MNEVKKKLTSLNFLIAEVPLFIVRKQGKETLGGRPDILHRCLITIHDSPVNELLPTNTFFTLQDGRVFRVLAQTRIPRMQHRFDGLIKQAIKKGEVKHRLIHEISVKELEEVFKKSYVIQLHENGELLPLQEFPEVLNERLTSNSLLFIVGGFPKGDFHKRYNSREVVSVYPKELTASSVINLILCGILWSHEQQHLRNKD